MIFIDEAIIQIKAGDGAPFYVTAVADCAT